MPPHQSSPETFLTTALRTIEKWAASEPSAAACASPIVNELVARLSASSGEVWLETEAHGPMARVGSAGEAQSPSSAEPGKPAKGLVREVLATGPLLRAASSDNGSEYATPLRAGVRTIGALLLRFDPPRRLNDDSLHVLALLGHEIGALMARSRETRKLSERDLQRQAVLASALDPIVTIDDAGVIVDYNKAAAELFGYPASAALGELAADLFIPPRYREQHLRGIGRFLETGRSRVVDQRNEFHALRSDGTEIPVELTVTCTRIGGRPLFTGFLRDLTRRRHVEAEQRRFETVSRLANEAHILITDDHRIDFINETGLRWIGASSGAEGEHQRKLLPELGERRMEELIGQLRAGPVTPFETLLRCIDGRQLPVEASATRVEFGESAFTFLSLRDVSERVRDRESLHRHNQWLAEQARRKDKFIALLAHELRNPLAPIRSSAEALDCDTLDAAQRPLVGMILRQSRVLQRLVTDLLEAARHAKKQLRVQLETVDLRDPASEALEMVREEARARKHQISVALPSEPVWVQADPVRLTQVVGNLLDNALKYTPDGGQIQLALTLHTERAFLSVRDSGRGINPSQLAGVFEAFERGSDNHTVSESGLGLGLHIVQAIVEQFDGHVTVDSGGRDQGSEFQVELPLCAAPVLPVTEPRLAGTGPPSPQPPASARRILIIDDHVDAATSLNFLLRRRGYDTQVAHTGQEGLERAADFEPEIVLLDIGLPDLSGHEVARRLRESRPEMRLIGVSGLGANEDPSSSVLDHRLVKPVSYRDLESLLGS